MEKSEYGASTMAVRMNTAINEEYTFLKVMNMKARSSPRPQNSPHSNYR